MTKSSEKRGEHSVQIMTFDFLNDGSTCLVHVVDPHMRHGLCLNIEFLTRPMDFRYESDDPGLGRSFAGVSAVH